MKPIIKNKKAFFDYEILETLDAGIVLAGHEVKALKTQKANLSDAFIKIDERELWLINCDIPLYKKTHPQLVGSYDPKGRRKLLVTARQRTRLRERTHKTGYRLIPLELLLDHKGMIKVKLALGKLKRKIDKRASIREKDEKKLMKMKY